VVKLKLYTKLNSQGYLDYSSSTRNALDEIEIEIPEGHEAFLNPFVFKLVNGTLVKDTVYQKTLIDSQTQAETRPSLQEEVAELKKQNADLVFTLLMKGVL
jgi:hypothetical protein